MRRLKNCRLFRTVTTLDMTYMGPTEYQKLGQAFASHFVSMIEDTIRFLRDMG